MPIPAYGFILSSHAIDRLYERHRYLFNNPDQTGKARKDSAYAVLDDAIEDRSFINDSNFMVHQREKYGYDNDLKFFINGQVLFVGVITVGYGSTKIITTTLVVDWARTNHIRNAVQNREETYGKKAAPTKWKRFHESLYEKPWLRK